ncbi:hypothetical protein KUTeg_019010, partial [Tegillarca granosa]
MHDIPYLHTSDVGPEIVACMSVICHKVKNIFQRGPVGVQLLAGANKQALAVGQAADTLKRINSRYHHITCGIFPTTTCIFDDDEMMMMMMMMMWIDVKEPNLRGFIFNNESVFSDRESFIKDIVRHFAHAITSDVSIAETAKAAQFFLSDAIIVTGSSTEVRKAVDIPVLVGSGVTIDNVHMYKSASGLIVGSEFKKNGHWQNELDSDRIEKFMEKVKDSHLENEDDFIN